MSIRKCLNISTMMIVLTIVFVNSEQYLVAQDSNKDNLAEHQSTVDDNKLVMKDRIIIEAKGGFNLSNANKDDNTKMYISFAGGAGVEFVIAKIKSIVLGAVLGVYYFQKGFSVERNNERLGIFLFDYISFPVLYKSGYEIPIKKIKIIPNIQTGISTNVSLTHGFRYSNYENDPGPWDFEGVKRVTVDFIISGGIEIAFKYGSLTLDFRADVGVTNSLSSSEYVKLNRINASEDYQIKSEKLFGMTTLIGYRLPLSIFKKKEEN